MLVLFQGFLEQQFKRISTKEGEPVRKGSRASAYVGSVGATTAVLASLEWIRIRPSSPLEFLYLSLLSIALVPVSILFLSTLVYVATRQPRFPRAAVAAWPRVAVLYVAYNDVLPQAIRLTLRNVDYPNAEIWLLSDSTHADAIALEEALPPSVRVFRRPSRRGGKAGIINDWLRSHAANVRYVVPMDSDAILAPGSLRTLVEIAEHPSNRRYAGFQTLMEIHPAVAPTAFGRILGPGVKWGSRILPLANQRIFGQAMYWGSNALLRPDVVLASGGWVENNICEDFALTASLDAAGHPIALVDIYNYEGFPPDALSLRERTTRWCKANLALFPTVIRAKTSFAVRLNVTIPLLFYLMAPVLISLLLVNIVAPPEMPLHRWSTTLGGSLLVFVFLHRLVAVPRNRVDLIQFGIMLLAETVVILSMSLRVAWCFVESLVRAPSWLPSRKLARRLLVRDAIRASVPEVAFGVLLVLLSIAYRASFPSVALASVWTVSFVLTPMILWLSFGPRKPSTSSVQPPRDRSERRISS